MRQAHHERGIATRRTVSQFFRHVNMAQPSFPVVANPAAWSAAAGGDEVRESSRSSAMKRSSASMGTWARSCPITRSSRGRCAAHARRSRRPSGLKPCATLPQVNALRGNEHLDAEEAREIAFIS